MKESLLSTLRKLRLSGLAQTLEVRLEEAASRKLTVLYRSIFDVVRDFLHDEAFGGEERVLSKYLKPDLLIVDDMGMKQLPQGIYTVLIHRAGRPSSIGIIPASIIQWKSFDGSIKNTSWSESPMTCSA